ncbi:MAG: PorP/SprF family type IX secretion system membrane protein [Bacteroidales bacterium]|nr:PorP/SprF family type IX secretion system membrane protein [Bacteroidales bacterium]
MRTRIAIIAFLLISISGAMGQDPHFSQFYANPLYINPAFAGNGICPSIHLNYRNQNSSSIGAYNTYGVSYDQYFDFLSGGIGIISTSDQQGGLLYSNQSAAIYSYHLELDKNLTARFALQGGYYYKGLDWNALVFPDQLEAGGSGTSQGNESQPETISIQGADFSAGVLLAGKNWYGGLAAHHLNRPKASFFETFRLGIKYTVHGGYHFEPKKKYFSAPDYSFSPNFIVQKQAKSLCFNYGFYANFESVVSGLWFRQDLNKGNSVILLIGFQTDNITFGYSYDWNISGIPGFSGRSHEISVLLNFGCRAKNLENLIIKCPTF